MRKIQRLAAYALVLHQESILLSKLGRGGNIGKWNLPGGGVEHSEAPEEAVVREIYEEAGFRITDTPKLLTVLSYHHIYPSKTEEPDEHYHSVGIIYVLRLKEQLTPKAGGDGDSSLGCEWFKIKDIKSEQVVSFVTRSLELLQSADSK
jgi:8-oxo-dGTP diphosphatase